MKTFSVRITLADGTIRFKELTASSATDLFDKCQNLANEYPTYVKSEGRLISAPKVLGALNTSAAKGQQA